MIKSYKYETASIQLKLHELILAFFSRIEYETGSFDDSFFEPDLLQITHRHPEILKKPCIDIYNIIRQWPQADRSSFCKEIVESNHIENICKGDYVPKKITRHATGLLKHLRDLFLNLYKQVLDGDSFNTLYSTSLRMHFNALSRLNGDLTLCPFCGIGELKKHLDVTRDQYDHYLPKAIYPLSAINFKNLVPACKECNSFDVKGEKDIVVISSNKKIFFPYDQTHTGISVAFKISVDDSNLENIIWSLTYTNPDNKADEILTWRSIYSIDARYQGFVKARIEKWYRHYWNYMNNANIAMLSDSIKTVAYDAFLEGDEESYLNFLRRPALNAFLAGSLMGQAEIQAKYYSI